ncbi:hypothetical protein H7K45_27750 [Mycobacterium yunnanensis]|uniref:Uncharacterized protein n=1 Tax=Mycobacterium yunnanensis TaxID=368477 RepID=A0A9X2YRM8_9MYCO|nr:hypothetical protein [Mycobacterium yunnanensis]MCV7424347.1 hypothetical protein [Mycobacterium yunnanensis]
MPQGVEVFVEGGVATVEFVDREKRVDGLNALLQAGGQQVRKVTRPRQAYVVPEDVARAAGLLDDAVDDDADTPPSNSLPQSESAGTGTENHGTKAPADGTTSTELVGDGTGEKLPELPDSAYPADAQPLDPPAEKAWPDGEPEADWRRPELDAYAASKGIDTRELPNRAAVVKAINDAKENAS